MAKTSKMRLSRVKTFLHNAFERASQILPSNENGAMFSRGRLGVFQVHSFQRCVNFPGSVSLPFAPPLVPFSPKMSPSYPARRPRHQSGDDSRCVISVTARTGSR